MVEPKIINAKIYHKRLFPKENQFRYKLYYLVFSIKKLSKLSRGFLFRINKFGLISFFEKDHFLVKNSYNNIKKILLENNLCFELEDVMLMTMPRVLGYVFNPVSFWFCLDKESNLMSVLVEVRNTFGESHNYLCYNYDQRKIEQNDIICVDKIFHVSPFISRQGEYKFKFLYKKNSKKIGVWIDYHDKKGQKLLVTSIIGRTDTYSSKNLLKCLLFYPLSNLKTIIMIHWQALKLFQKGIKYIPLPKRLKKRFSTIKQKENK